MSRVRTREWSSTDYYAVLGLDAGVAPAELDVRYRELAKTLHPDRNTDPEDQERFKQVSAAYAALKDPTTRQAYDEFRARIAAGTLYGMSPPRPPAPSPRTGPHGPVGVPRRRGPVPVWLRIAFAGLLMVLGVVGLAWAAFGELPSPTDADTPLAVQVTLVIMALKFMACAVAVAWYPQLRARWHH